MDPLRFLMRKMWIHDGKLTRHGVVLSEVGSKDATHIIPTYKWIELMKAELDAGSTYVIAEARRGNVGIYRGSGK